MNLISHVTKYGVLFVPCDGLHHCRKLIKAAEKGKSIESVVRTICSRCSLCASVKLSKVISKLEGSSDVS